MRAWLGCPPCSHLGIPSSKWLRWLACKRFSCRLPLEALKMMCFSDSSESGIPQCYKYVHNICILIWTKSVQTLYNVFNSSCNFISSIPKNAKKAQSSCRTHAVEHTSAGYLSKSIFDLGKQPLGALQLLPADPGPKIQKDAVPPAS